MYAVLNQSPDVIRALLRHKAIDVTIKNDYDQNIIDILKEHPDVDSKIRTMVQVAYAKQTQPPEEEQSLDHHISAIKRIVQSQHIDAPARKVLKQQLGSSSAIVPR